MTAFLSSDARTAAYDAACRVLASRSLSPDDYSRLVHSFSAAIYGGSIGGMEDVKNPENIDEMQANIRGIISSRGRTGYVFSNPAIAGLATSSAGVKAVEAAAAVDGVKPTSERSANPG